MVQTIQAQNINLRDLKENFGLELTDDEQFFREWQDNLPELTDVEQQALTCMLGSPNVDKPTFGFVTNGTEFIFLKLTKQGTPKYAESDLFSLRNRGDLYTVLNVLKRFSQLVSQ